MSLDDVFKISVDPQHAGTRLDTYTADCLPDCSRTFAAALIRRGAIRVDGGRRKPGYRVKARDLVEARRPPPQPVAALSAEAMDLDLVFEDEWLIVVNKPPGLVVHPAAGHPDGTLVNGLLFHCPDLEGIGGERRPGIVHRLDKDTSGLIVVAKSAIAHHELARQFKARLVRKHYLALVHGVPAGECGTVDLPIGRHPRDRKRMSTLSRRGREALTMWRVKASFGGLAALLEVDLKTGRTHQIRVHCHSMGHPLVGDKVYGGAKSLVRLARTHADFHAILHSARRQMLHSARLEIVHPVSGRPLSFSAALPEDMVELIQQLESHT